MLSPPGKPFQYISPARDLYNSPTKAPQPRDALRSSSIALVPSALPFNGPARGSVHGPVASPSTPIQKHHHHHARNKYRNSAPKLPHPAPAPTYGQQGPSVSPFQSPFRTSSNRGSHAPALAPTLPSRHVYMPIPQPTISPTGSSLKKTKASPVMTLPPPPPNNDCASVTCTEPLTYTPPGSPCGCVWPIQVKLRLGVAINTFFSLVSELANEIAGSLAVNLGQVRITGANAAREQLEKSTVLINLVPPGVKFDDVTAFSIYKKFWERRVFIKASHFGAYEVLYVHYPGLPPSPPSSPLSISAVDDGPYGGRENHGQEMKPLGVDVPRRRKSGVNGSMIAIIVLSCFTAFVICLAIAWLLVWKCGTHIRRHEQHSQDFISSPAKASGALRSTKYGSRLSSSSMSLDSNAMTYTGSAKTFTLNEMERATNKFDSSRVIGEGGFGVVYRGIMDDGKEVAIKVLKRDDQHGGREFLAEVEMLSRLHHRNLVKLIGICTEVQTRCLVYELVPNGSVESHLHGCDKEHSPLDWDARMKIALGAARGLAYLHEDSSPRVIHRDFKSSNILLEHDFTPKVSDFGLARAALDEGNKHISTHVMGTFGYLAPEYAMTGHLLVKSDVYSYGVVLLELLTGRKPVDLSQPPGQENLVAWARPLLTTKEGLDMIIDPIMKSNVSHDIVTKVAAIASMCVQPEVSHRPFMGEVVQALKLVCHEFDETRESEFRDPDEDSASVKVNELSGELPEGGQPMFGQNNSMGLSTSELLSTPMGVEDRDSGSFRRNFSSGPLRTGRRMQFWQRLRNLSRGSMSEHGFSSKFWPGSHS